MKLHSLTIMAGTAVCLLAACSREQLAPEPQGRYTITAIRESGGTKTSVDEDYSLNWNAEDVIGVFNGADHHRLTLTDGEGTPTATFELSEGALEEGDVFAYYPYDEGTALTEDGKIAVDLGEQTFEFDAESKDLDNFGKYFYMTGKATAEAGSTNVDVSFRNPLSAFVFNLSNNGEEILTIKSVSVETTDGSKVFGTAGTLDLTDPGASEATTITKAASASASLNSVVLEIGAAIDIPVVVFPCDLSGKELVFTVTYTAGEDAGEQTISKTLTGRNLARNSFAVIRLDFGENAAVEDLQEVLKNGGTYALTCSITGNFTVTSTDHVTINLNGFTITNDPSSEGTGDTFTVNLGSDLTISGEGTVDNTSHGKAAIYNNGTVTLNGGTYTRSAENSSYTVSENPDFNSYYVILNHGEMTINEGVNIVSSGTYSSLINTGYRDYLAEDERSGYIEGKGQEYPQLTINGGTFEGGVITIKNDLNGTLDIYGGNFTNSTVGNIQNAYITTINGGNFKHKAGTNHIASVSCGGADAPYSRGATTINGGTFEGGTIIAEGSEGTEGTEAEKASMIVNGGSFYCCNFSNSSGRSGHESGVVSINNGSFTIGTWDVLQSIAGFLTEDARITAKAKNGLMYNICKEPIIFNAQEVTLDLNGKTLTLPRIVFMGDKASYTITGGTLEIEGTGSGLAIEGQNSELTLDGVTINAGKLENGESAITCGNNDKPNSSGNVLTVKNSTITSKQTGINLRRGQILVVENSIITHGWFGITQNGVYPGSSVTVKGKTQISGYATGIYLSNNAEGEKNILTVENSTISSVAGSPVEVKKTDLTISGTTLKSDADPTYDFNGGGAGGSGYGIVLAGYKSGKAYEGDYEKSALISDNTFELKAGDGYKLFVYNGSNDKVPAN